MSVGNESMNTHPTQQENTGEAQDMPSDRNTVRLQSLLAAFYVAARGILYCIIHERNMKIHLGCALIVLVAGCIVHLAAWEWCACLLCIALVCALECMNTALEASVNLATARYHELARIAKDAAAGSVLVAAFFSLIIGLLIFVPHILH